MRGSKKGERRGGRKKGVRNRATAIKIAAIDAASTEADTTPLSFLLSVMRDARVSTDLRISVAKTAARLVHGKGNTAPVQIRHDNAGASSEPDGFTIDIAEAKTFRDMQHRWEALLRKRSGPSENGGPPTAAEIAEAAVLRVAISNRAQALKCPPKYGPGDFRNDSNRLHQLLCKRLMPRSCGGGTLTSAEDDEEAFLTARVAAYRYSPEGRDRDRIRALEWKDISGCLSPDEKAELDNLKLVYPENPSANSREQSTRRAELRRRFAK
jgi:hypothetical protein